MRLDSRVAKEPSTAHERTLAHTFGRSVKLYLIVIGRIVEAKITMRRGWAAGSINFLTGIAARRHHSQVRNNPWTMFFYGDSLHQKVAGRSSPTPIITPTVSMATGGKPSRESFVGFPDLTFRNVERLCSIHEVPPAAG